MENVSRELAFLFEGSSYRDLINEGIFIFILFPQLM